jgi:hypothetical protein
MRFNVSDNKQGIACSCEVSLRLQVVEARDGSIPGQYGIYNVQNCSCLTRLFCVFLRDWSGTLFDQRKKASLYWKNAKFE